ncbi:hypothetical protein cypCar_00021199 [Cyprinus carpio]|nr:hypothetical protein cypCar_00021199 [Cyprinus carpio]
MRYWSASKEPKMACLKIYTLSFLILIAFFVETDAVSCCLSYTKHPRRCGILKGYIIQNMTGSCDLAAIMMKAARVKTGGF